MKISTPAFVLKTSIYKESSLIVRLFTFEKGKATYIIKAAMRQKSPNKAIYQQLNEIKIDYAHYSKRQIHPVYNSKLLNDWTKICSDLKKTVLCTAMLEIIDKTFDENIPDKKTYNVLNMVMKFFDKNEKNLNNAFYFFLINFLRNSGYDIINAKNHPIIKRFKQKNPELLSDLNNIFESDFVLKNSENIITSYDKKVMSQFIAELVRYHFPDIKSFSVAKDVFN
ncbi:MAG: DNA repair protein RecO [Flammeovirgaceae bacterium TMED290]|nr:MAG: DNA repair protein RecO [Flammeovirgaceae bacterium TMED290]|tara:strand:+ start:3771 stop:4445 length:675 start_codon:yes stop_codon:yes gene_type:complete